MIRIVWFNNSHEQRNDLLRLRFMRLHRGARLEYQERPLAHCVEFGFSRAVTQHIHRHTSVVLAENDSVAVRCLVDSEDSFFQISPLISEFDVYFCAGYNAQFFEDRAFPRPYTWQKRHEVQYYKDRVRMLVDTYGEYFDRVRRFVPIGPGLAPASVGWLRQKRRNANDKLRRYLNAPQSWRFRHQDLEARYLTLLELRKAPLRYDVVLQDTLWGWPRHRHALHRRLGALAERYAIHSQLSWSEPAICDGGADTPLDSTGFPLLTGHIGDYEQMLASSRLGVFATGFHWGWRSIMMVALLCGIPVHADRLILEPWFDMDRFTISWNETGDWRDLEDRLESVSDAEWERTKTHNQRAYDEVMAPEKVAGYFVREALSEHSPDRLSDLPDTITKRLRWSD